VVIHLERVADCLHMVQLVLLHTQNPISFLAVVLFLAMAVLVFTSLFCVMSVGPYVMVNHIFRP